jgi:hypothetical protein
MTTLVEWVLGLLGLYNLLPKVLDADPVINAGLQAEFQAVKIEMYNIACSYSSTMPCFFEGLQLLQDSKMQLLKYANVMNMLYIMLCIPLNTACCEHRFSIHTAVKDKSPQPDKHRDSGRAAAHQVRVPCRAGKTSGWIASKGNQEGISGRSHSSVSAACPKTYSKVACWG